MQIKIDYQEAKAILESQKTMILGVERVFLHQALGRVLAYDIVAMQDMPQSPYSNMDGYAIHSKFLKKNSKEQCFTILGENPAGNAQDLILPLHQPYAIKTFTGAKIPQNADTLVPLEQVRVESQTIHLLDIQKAGEFI